MSQKIYLNWEEVDLNWENETQLWEEVIRIIEQVTIGGAGRNPQEEEEIRKQLEKLGEVKTDKLISVMILLGNQEYKEKRKKNENIKIKVEDVKTILNEIIKVKIQ
jgi:hypothetical protein